MRVEDLTGEDEARLIAVARLLVDGFRDESPDAWQNLASALAEVRESLAPDRISVVAIAEDGQVVGWIGGIYGYGGHAWELHPLVVAENWRRRGIGRALVAALETRVRERGATTLWLGTDDENDRTSLAGIDLHPNVWEHVARIRDLRGHPFVFYRKVGFAIVGVIPDANGPGKPDILMAKRVG